MRWLSCAVASAPGFFSWTSDIGHTPLDPPRLPPGVTCRARAGGEGYAVYCDMWEYVKIYEINEKHMKIKEHNWKSYENTLN